MRRDKGRPGGVNRLVLASLAKKKVVNPTVQASAQEVDLELGNTVQQDVEATPSAAVAENTVIDLSTWHYHPDDARSHMDGFFGSLTQQQEAALEELRQAVVAADLDVALVQGDLDADPPCPQEPLTLCLLRFLRGNGFVVQKAMQQLVENVEWRTEHDTRGLLRKAPADILGCDPEEVNKWYPHWNFGSDRFGRPVICKSYGGFKVWEVRKLTGIPELVASHMWEQEKTLQLLRRRTAASENIIVDSVVVIIDVAKMGMGQVTKDFISLMKQVAHVDQRLFPEMLGAMFIINTPGLFSYVWSMFTPMLDPRTVAKINIYSGRADWQPALLALVPSDQLPPEYGGTGPDLADIPSLSTSHMRSDQLLRQGGDPQASIAINSNTPLPQARPPLSPHRQARPASLARPLSSSWRRAVPEASPSAPTLQEAQSSVDMASNGYFDMVMSALGLGVWWKGPQVPRLGDADSNASGSPRSSVGSDDQYYDARDFNVDSNHIDMSNQHSSRSRSHRRQNGSRPVSMEHSGRSQGAPRDPIRGGGSQATQPALLVMDKMYVFGEYMKRAARGLSRPVAKTCQPVMNRLKRYSVEELSLCLHTANAFYMFLSTLTIAFGAYMISHVEWVSETVAWMMWVAVVVVSMGCLVLILSVFGTLATRYQNQASLTMYVVFLALISVVLLVSAAFAFALAAGDDQVTTFSWNAVSKSLPPGTTKEDFEHSQFHKLIMVGTAALVLSLYSLVPSILSAAVAAKLDEEAKRPGVSQMDRLKDHEKQLRRALVESTFISTSFALVCVGYGLNALAYLFKLGLSTNVSNMFMFVATGAMLIILGAIGLWASKSSNVQVFTLHLTTLIPATVFVFIWAVATLAGIGQCDGRVEAAWTDLRVRPGTALETVQTRVKTTLLVGGILMMCTSCCLMGTVFCSSVVRQHLIKHGALQPTIDKNHQRIWLSRAEWAVVAYATVVGLETIFVEGTYVIFNAWVEKKADLWLVQIWSGVGKIDQRYVDSEAYVVAMEGLLALVVGPCLLVYAWAIFSRQGFRHILGSLVCLVMIVLQALYFVTEIHSNFADTAAFSSVGLFWFCFVFLGLLRMVIPAIVMGWNVRHLYRRVHAAEVKYAKLVEQHDRLRRRARLGVFTLTSSPNAADSLDGTGDELDMTFRTPRAPGKGPGGDHFWKVYRRRGSPPRHGDNGGTVSDEGPSGPSGPTRGRRNSHWRGPNLGAREVTGSSAQSCSPPSRPHAPLEEIKAV